MSGSEEEDEEYEDENGEKQIRRVKKKCMLCLKLIFCDSGCDYVIQYLLLSLEQFRNLERFCCNHFNKFNFQQFPIILKTFLRIKYMLLLLQKYSAVLSFDNDNHLFFCLASKCLSPTTIKKIKDQIDAERNALLDKKNLAEDEKDKVERELEKREKELSKAQYVFHFPFLSKIKK